MKGKKGKQASEARRDCKTSTFCLPFFKFNFLLCLPFSSILKNLAYFFPTFFAIS